MGTPEGVRESESPGLNVGDVVCLGHGRTRWRVIAVHVGEIFVRSTETGVQRYVTGNRALATVTRLWTGADEDGSLGHA